MCFRPAEADAGVHPVKCSCGKMVFPVEGILPSKCPFCHEPLDAGAPAPGPKPAAPGAPATPGASKAPGSPLVPGAPKPPATPASPAASGDTAQI